MLENLANYRICHAKGLVFFFFTWGWVQKNHAIAKHLILTQQPHNSNWPQRVTRGALEDCLQFSSLCFTGSGFCQYGEREFYGSGTQLCPSSSFNLSPRKQSLMSLKCFFGRKTCSVFSVFPVKLKRADGRLRKGIAPPQAERELGESKREGEKVKTLWLYYVFFISRNKPAFTGLATVQFPYFNSLLTGVIHLSATASLHYAWHAGKDLTFPTAWKAELSSLAFFALSTVAADAICHS